MRFDPHCATHVHCRTCRTDPDWRRQVGAPDDCPHGVTLDDMPEPAYAVLSLASEREPSCKACVDACMIHHLASCRRRATLNRPNFICPHDRF